MPNESDIIEFGPAEGDDDLKSYAPSCLPWPRRPRSPGSRVRATPASFFGVAFSKSRISTISTLLGAGALGARIEELDLLLGVPYRLLAVVEGGKNFHGPSGFVQGSLFSKIVKIVDFENSELRRRGACGATRTASEAAATLLGVAGGLGAKLRKPVRLL